MRLFQVSRWIGPGTADRVGPVPPSTAVALSGVPVMLTVRELVRLFSGYHPRPRAAAEVLAALEQPTTGMDVESPRQFWDIVRDLAGRGTTVIVATHLLEEADAPATPIDVIDRGRVLRSIARPCRTRSPDRPHPGVPLASGSVQRGARSSPSSAPIHRASGSASTRSAFTRSVSGMASSPPSGPRTTAQKTSERKVTVADRPTVSPTTLGWMSDWITKFATE